MLWASPPIFASLRVCAPSQIHVFMFLFLWAASGLGHLRGVQRIPPEDKDTNFGWDACSSA